MIDRPLVIVGGSASKELAGEIASYLNIPLGHSETRRFSDSETWVKINDNVRGADVFVVQSTYTPANDNLMELLLLIDALKRASAARINAVIPYFGYARQDRKDQGRVALSAKLVANLITEAGADRVIALDLHANQLQGFFDIPVDHLLAWPLLIKHCKSLNLENYVVVSPDVGNVKLARSYADRLGAPLAIIDKRRPAPNVSEVMSIIGEIAGKNVFLFDDMIDTAGTIVNGATALIERGAQDVYACCTHPVFSGPARERLSGSPIKKIIVTNTIPQKTDGFAGKLEIISIAPLIGEAIRRIHQYQSVSELFN
ncbi:MAG TPA: ribose-phosphate pyrophosphokinase [Candidatus Sumerlaeota bacterium]|nr:MAG: Ribose-phosphate pyrophosphokinase [candidate division BRC1 bacterium ADurb.Bin183]HOE63605.1 ribose-phosphate pyrophosphokinase [Candidatus Sumerlaeota bacterium]HRR30715.1 ribose-phosphate pyrophosphokinase [Candidatus Sumerlaeia bacterium]HON50501.1 ribose-phosphate pyrophosphokinase [Candidatus Sumerlaeota bacterium]HOR63716.1 ribose-phosphate pyrophosphokinase [Candidatus Sumerlaeota bacterium]